MKIYISGKITDNPDYREQFSAASSRLRAQGHTVFNPAHNPTGLTRLDYMRIDLPMLLSADAIYLLKGWEDSPGAQMERQLAEYVGLEVAEEC